MPDRLRALILRLAALHAPLGRGTPFAASALFAGAGFSHSPALRAIAYCGACILVLLIAADLAKSFIDERSYPRRAHAQSSWQILVVRTALAAILGGIYSSLVFLGVGMVVPLILWPAIFGICCFVAWRNIDLWYQQGACFEEELREEQQLLSRPGRDKAAVRAADARAYVNTPSAPLTRRH